VRRDQPPESDLETWTVAELHPAINEAFTDAGLTPVAVRGTVTSTKAHKTVTAFQLVSYDERMNPVAVLHVAAVGPARAAIETALGHPIRDGIDLTVTGTLQTRADWGQLRLNAAGVIGRAVTADATRHRDELVSRYRASGAIDNQQRLAKPLLPIRVGAIYGSNSAAQADIRRILTTRQTPVQLIEAPIFTTGVDAPARIASAINRFARDRNRFDLLIVARGGGGRAELDVFDTEEVVSAITESNVPVWTAIGHASDLTFADRCAQQHFATPTGVAEEIARLHTLSATTEREREQKQAALRHISTAQQETKHAYDRNRRLLLVVVVLVCVVALLVAKAFS
jgi:exodeoxyribonuclease VII large subunit